MISEETRLNASALHPSKVDWKRSQKRQQMRPGLREVWQEKFVCSSLHKDNRRHLKLAQRHLGKKNNHRKWVISVCAAGLLKLRDLSKRQAVERKAQTKLEAEITGCWTRHVLFTAANVTRLILSGDANGTERCNVFISPAEDKGPYLVKSLACHLLGNGAVTLNTMYCNHKPYRVNTGVLSINASRHVQQSFIYWITAKESYWLLLHQFLYYCKSLQNMYPKMQYINYKHIVSSYEVKCDITLWWMWFSGWKALILPNGLMEAPASVFILGSVSDFQHQNNVSYLTRVFYAYAITHSRLRSVVRRGVDPLHTNHNISWPRVSYCFHYTDTI